MVILYIYNLLYSQEFNLETEINYNTIFELSELIDITFDKKNDEEKQEILNDSLTIFQTSKKLLDENLAIYTSKLSGLSSNWKFTGLMVKSILLAFCVERDMLPIDKEDSEDIKINLKTLNLYLKVSAKYLDLAQISTIHAILGKLSL